MIAIDRLVLSIDGMSSQRAERLVRMVGEQLARDAAQGASPSVKSVDRIEMALPAGGHSDADIVAALCAAVRARIG